MLLAVNVIVLNIGQWMVLQLVNVRMDIMMMEQMKNVNPAIIHGFKY